MIAQPNIVQYKTESLDELRRVIARGELYAILDACDSPAVGEKVKSLGDKRAVSLYRGSGEGEEYSDVAPYLACVDGALLDWIHTTLWTEPWGIFAIAKTDLESLRKHFRTFLVVEKPDAERAYFRFYDPRILKAFVPVCSADELNEFFGPVQVYGTANLQPGSLTLWRK